MVRTRFPPPCLLEPMKVLLVGGPADSHILPLSEDQLQKGRLYVSARRNGLTDTVRHRYDIRPFEHRGRVYLMATVHETQIEPPQLVEAIAKCRAGDGERPSAYKARPGSPLDTWAPDGDL